MYSFLYNLFIHLMILGMKIGSIFNSKLRLGINGRKQSFKIIQENFSPEDQVIWMHAASLGEYEQGLPVLERLKSEFPHYKILITFFSPSGFEIVKKRKHIADVLCYLPLDTKANINNFISNFQTKIFLAIKYDYWYNLLKVLKQNNTKIFVVSALFYDKQIFFKPFGKWFNSELKTSVDWFFHQNETSLKLAKTIGLNQCSISGDTRFDRVRQNKERFLPIDFIDNFRKNNTLIIFGSSWEAEEKIAELIINKNRTVKIIIAPHDLKRIENLKNKFPNSILYSKLSKNSSDFENQILIIDSIGLLSRLYYYADIAVIGGGFHAAGLHNILEASAFGVPTFFGNHYKKNPEADALIEYGGAKSFKNEKDSAQFILDLIQNNKLQDMMKHKAFEFIEKQPNASKTIINHIKKAVQLNF